MLFKKSPHSTKLELIGTEFEKVVFSIANRAKRNGSDLYQQKHLSGTSWTRDRSPALNNLNIPVEEHFRIRLGIADILANNDIYLVLSVGDCTANLFRASFDSSQISPLFYLQEEPLYEKKHYAFIVRQTPNGPSAHINKIDFQNEIPLENGSPIENLLFLFCSTPIVYKSAQVDAFEMAVNDYDLRHFFGKRNSLVTDPIYKQSTRDDRFSYQSFVEAIDKARNHILTSGDEVQWYHACIGIKGETILVLHMEGNLIEIGKRLLEEGVTDALLLDSGGSSLIWTNENKKGNIACQTGYHRPARGAVMMFKIKGNHLFLL